MDLTTIDPIWWIVLGVLVVLLIGLVVWSGRRKAHRSQRLKGQFKSEYDRATSSDSKKRAEDDLEHRLTRRGDVDLADLAESDAESLQHHLDELLRSFVDGPQGAALGMTQLVGRVATARGYVATEAGVLDLVSVDHPEQVAAMRRSEAELQKSKGAELTEASRRLFLDARALAHRLLAEGRAGHAPEGAGERSSPEPGPPESETPTGSPPPPPEAHRDVRSEPTSTPPPPVPRRDTPRVSSSTPPPPEEPPRDEQPASSGTPPPPEEPPRDEQPASSGMPPPPEEPPRSDQGDARDPVSGSVPDDPR